MPIIPMYQQQQSPSGLVQVAPSSVGGMGRTVEGFGQAIGQIAPIAAQAVRQDREDTQSVYDAHEEKRLADIEFQGKAWAAKAFSNAQLAVVDSVNQAQRSRGQGQIDTASIIRKQGAEWIKKTLDEAPSDQARQFAKQNIETTWVHAERSAMENDDAYRTDWGVRQFEEANDAQQIAIQDAPQNMVDTAFMAAAKNVRDSLAGLSLDPETKAKLSRKMLSESVERAGTKIIQTQGPEAFLDLVQGVRREFAGKKTVSRPGNGRWSMEIQQAAQETGVDPNLIEAVMSAESSGNAGVVSPKGAVGLMQLMPDTAQELGVDPTKPEQNVLGGAKYLGQLLKRYGGNEDKAIAAYNAGMGNVDKAGGVPNFKETKEYVSKVKSERDRFKSAAGELKITREQIPAWWEFATADDRDKLVDAALRMRQELAAANMQFLTTWKQNADAAQSNGLPVPSAPSQQVVAAAFAGDETKANAWAQQNIQPFEQVRALSSKMGGMTIAEMDKQINAIRPDASRTDDPNLAADMARVNAAEKARREILDRRSRDPMRQALDQPSVKMMAKDPEAMIAAAVAWQRDNVPEGKRSVLLDADKKKLEDAWMNPQATAGGLSEIERMQRDYGAYFDDALMEIAPKATSDALLFAGMNVDPKTAPARSRMRALASKTLDEVVVGNEAKKKQIKDAVGRMFEPFFSSFKHTNQIEGSKYVENIGDAVTKYAASLTNAGLDPKRAAKKAFEDIVSSQYGFVDGGRSPSGRAQVRIPRNIASDRDLTSMVEDGLEQAAERPPKELAFPAGVSRSDGLDGAYWATSANDRGAVMMFRGAPVRVLRDGKLVPFELSWNAILNAGKRHQMR